MPLNDDERAQLLAALEAASAVAASSRTVDQALFFQCLVLRDDPEKAPPAFRELRSAIDRTHALEIFDHAEQRGLWPSMRITRHFLVGWMLSRAQQVGCEQVIVELNRYLETETLTLTESLLVDGFELEAGMHVGDFRLDRWGDWPMSDTKWQIAASGMYSHGPDVVISRMHDVPRQHLRPWDAGAPLSPPSIEPLMDALRCVTLVTGAAWRLRHYTILGPEWAPWAAVRSAFGADLSTMPRHVQVTGQDAGRITACLTRFAAIDESTRQRLRIPMDRLNESLCAGFNGVEAAIDLGIALESLYGPFSENASIGPELRRRVNQVLGGSSKERGRLGKKVTDAYDLRSRAVHAGRFDADATGQKSWADHSAVIAALEAGQTIVARSLEHFVMEGEPAWPSGESKPSNEVSGAID